MAEATRDAADSGLRRALRPNRSSTGGHRRGQAPLAVEGRPRSPTSTPPAWREAYESGGASCLSVLTDAEHFGGSADDLRRLPAPRSLPVLRKDFTVSANDVCDARLMGADCVLLIVAALDDAELTDFPELAAELGLDVAGRDPRRGRAGARRAAPRRPHRCQPARPRHLRGRHERAVRMAGAIPDGVVRVAESGVRGRDDAVAWPTPATTPCWWASRSSPPTDRRRGDAPTPCRLREILSPDTACARYAPSRVAVRLSRSVTAMFVKICGITNEDDACWRSPSAPTPSGSSSPRRPVRSPPAGCDITRRLPPEILTVGVFRDQSPSRVDRDRQPAGLQAAQLHGHEPPATRRRSPNVRADRRRVVAGSTRARPRR